MGPSVSSMFVSQFTLQGSCASTGGECVESRNARASMHLAIMHDSSNIQSSSMKERACNWRSSDEPRRPRASTSCVQGSLQLHNVQCACACGALHTHTVRTVGLLYRFFCAAALTPTAVSSAPTFCQSTTAEIWTENAAPGPLWGHGAPGRIET